MKLQKMIKSLLNTSATCLKNSNRNLHTTTLLNGLFYEKDERGGYRSNDKQPSPIQLIREGLKELKEEVKLWTQELKEDFETDPIAVFRPGETDIAFKINNNNIDKWVVTTDSDNGEGFSTASLKINQYGRAVFSGELSTRVPKDGRIKRTGYCNIRSPPARKSFKRETYLNWAHYNMLVLRVRGDGRSYMLNITTKGYYDVMWNDMFHYVLYTRGGPYWQLTKIPFSKFFLSSKGRIQDKQFPVPLHRVSSFGISLGDKIEGNFNLELDYIGLEHDPSHTEEFAYEMYKTDRNIAAH